MSDPRMEAAANLEEWMTFVETRSDDLGMSTDVKRPQIDDLRTVLDWLYEIEGATEVRPSDSRAESQAGLSGPSGSPKPPRALRCKCGHPLAWHGVAGEGGPCTVGPPCECREFEA